MNRTFDPTQPRDPNGKWSNGMPDVIHSVGLSLGGHKGSVEALPGDKLRFRLGSAEVTVPRDSAAKQMAKALNNKTGGDISDVNGDQALLFHFGDQEDDDETGGHTPLSLEFVDQGVTVPLSRNDERNLGDAFENAASARRFEVKSGPVDTFLDGEKYDHYAVRTKSGFHDPVTLSFDQKSWKRLRAAEAGLIDEEGDSFSVKTNEGSMIVMRTSEPDERGRFDITIGPHDERLAWGVTYHWDTHDEPWGEAVEALDVGHAAVGHYARAGAMPDSRGSLMTGLQQQRAIYAARLSTGKGDRFVRQFQVRAQMTATGDSGTTLEGYASVTGSPYSVRDWLGEYDETIERGAFKKTLAERDDVRLLLNHDGLPLARTSSGTMTLAEDDQGLRVTAELDKRSNLTNDVAVAMERGDLTEMSFAFAATRQAWNEDYTQRSISEVKLFDVSVVTYPANPATTVKLRAADLDELCDDELRELVARAQRRLAPRIDPTALDALRLAVSLTE